MSKHDKIEKRSIFKKVYGNKMLRTLELKLEPSNFTIPYVCSFKSENFMFFELARLNIIQNFIFNPWMEEDISWEDFDTHDWSPF